MLLLLPLHVVFNLHYSSVRLVTTSAQWEAAPLTCSQTTRSLKWWRALWVGWILLDWKLDGIRRCDCRCRSKYRALWGWNRLLTKHRLLTKYWDGRCRYLIIVFSNNVYKVHFIIIIQGTKWKCRIWVPRCRLWWGTTSYRICCSSYNGRYTADESIDI